MTATNLNILIDVTDLSDIAQSSSPQRKSRKLTKRNLAHSNREIEENQKDNFMKVGYFRQGSEMMMERDQKDVNVNGFSVLSEGKINIKKLMDNNRERSEQKHGQWTPKANLVQNTQKNLKLVLINQNFSSYFETIENSQSPMLNNETESFSKGFESPRKFGSNVFRNKIVNTWKFFFDLINFKVLTKDYLRDTRNYNLLNKWLGLSEELLCTVTKFGSDYSKTTSSKYERIDFYVVQDMFTSKLEELFVCLFLEDNFKDQSEKESQGPLQKLRSYLLQIYILMIVRVRGIPEKISDMVIRELNKDRKVLFNLLDECNLFEVCLFVFQFRNTLKVASLLDASKYNNKHRFLHNYLNPLAYSIFSERNLVSNSSFQQITNQIFKFFGARKPLVRQKLGAIVTFILVVFLEYLEFENTYDGSKLEQKIDLVRERSSTKFIESGRKNPSRVLFQKNDNRSQRTKFRKLKTLGSIEFKDTDSLEFPISPDKELSDVGSFKDSLNEKVSSSKSNMNSLNNEYLAENQFEDVVKNMDDIIKYGFDILGLRVSRETKENIIMKIDLIAKTNTLLESEDQNIQKIQRISQEIFESFVKLLSNKDDMVFTSFKIGELLFYCFYMSIGCEWTNEVFGPFM